MIDVTLSRQLIQLYSRRNGQRANGSQPTTSAADRQKSVGRERGEIPAEKRSTTGLVELSNFTIAANMISDITSITTTN